MAHILEFSVAGLAGRQETYSAALDRETNVFFGLNGSGKTSLLKILDSAMSGRTEQLYRVPFDEAEVTMSSPESQQEFVRNIEKTSRIRAVAKHFTESGGYLRRMPPSMRRDLASEFEWKTVPEVAESELQFAGIHRYLPTSRLNSPSQTGSETGGYLRYDEELSEDQLDLIFAASVADLWKEYSSIILSKVREAQEDGLASILQAVLSPQSTASDISATDVLDPDNAYETVMTFLKRQGRAYARIGKRAEFSEQYQQDPTLKRVVRDINEVEKTIGEATEPRTRLQNLVERMFTGPKSIEFLDRDIIIRSRTGDHIGLSCLSSGEKHVLRLLVEALLVGPNSMLIDEPEISLHVDWQRDLIASLRTLNPDMQLVVATHSPEIMADIPDKNIHRM